MRTTLAILATALVATAAACTEPLDDLGETEAEAKLGVADPNAVVPPFVEPVACGATKVLVCHIPPGNPANAHNLCVSEWAVPAHLEQHGDNVGGCARRTVEPPPPACMPLASECTVDAQCCSGSCVWGECIDQV